MRTFSVLYLSRKTGYRKQPLRKMRELIDVDLIYEEVKDSYGTVRDISIPPQIILKLILLFFFYNVWFEEELVETPLERLDWLWFWSMVLMHPPLPNHGVLSKATNPKAHFAYQNPPTQHGRSYAQSTRYGLVRGQWRGLWKVAIYGIPQTLTAGVSKGWQEKEVH